MAAQLVAQAMAAIDPWAARVDAAVGNHAILTSIAQRLGVPKKYVTLAAVCAFAAFVIFGIGQSLLSILLGVAYPAYQSMKALETHAKDDDTQWLTYWVVFSAFTVLEQGIKYILYFMPFYFTAKIAFLVWLQHPSTRGATVLWNLFLRSAFLKYEARIDEVLSVAGSAASGAAGAARNVAASAAGAVTSAAARSGAGAALAPKPSGVAVTDIFGEAPIGTSKTD